MSDDITKRALEDHHEKLMNRLEEENVSLEMSNEFLQQENAALKDRIEQLEDERRKRNPVILGVGD
jgi:cell division protein FtsB